MIEDTIGAKTPEFTPLNMGDEVIATEEIVEVAPAQEAQPGAATVIEPNEEEEFAGLGAVVPAKGDDELSEYEKEEQVAAEAAVSTPKTGEEADAGDPNAGLEMGVGFGLLKIPEGFEFDGTEEGLEEVIEYSKEQWQEEAAENIYSRVTGDQHMVEIVKYAINGGKFADMEKYVSLKTEQLQLDNVDLTDNDTAKHWITRRFKDANLDASSIKTLVENIEDAQELEEKAKDAVNYFREKNVGSRRGMIEDGINQTASSEKATREYYKSINNELRESKLPRQSQQEVIDSFSQVDVNGVELPQYQARILEVQSNPKHMIELLQFLNTYDADKGFAYTKGAKKAKTEEVKSKLDFLRKGGKGLKGGQKRVQTRSGVRSNPLDNNITIY